jgi:hypothetical protein
MLVLWICVCASRVVVMGRGEGHLAVCTSALVSRVDGWRQKCKARPRREHVSSNQAPEEHTIVSEMVVGAVAEAMIGAVVVAEAVVVVGVVVGLEIMKVAGSREPAVPKYYD